jgi:hypothetical protein
VTRGRYIEGKIHFQESEAYTPDGERALIKGGKLTGTYSLGEGKTSTQVKPVEAVDIDTGEIINILGETTVLVPFETMKGQIETMPHMQYVHDKLDKLDRWPYNDKANAGVTENIINVPDGAKLDFFEDSTDKQYRWGDKVLSGAYIHRNAREKNDKVIRDKRGPKNDPIIIDDNLNMGDVADSPDIYYKWPNGEVESGASMYEFSRKSAK